MQHDSTKAVYLHYGKAMIEYPGGSLLALKPVHDASTLLNGEAYVIETNEYTITRKIYDDGNDIIAYSTNKETYPDGRQVFAPIRIPKDTILSISLVLGCVSKLTI